MRATAVWVAAVPWGLGCVLCAAGCSSSEGERTEDQGASGGASSGGASSGGASSGGASSGGASSGGASSGGASSGGASSGGASSGGSGGSTSPVVKVGVPGQWVKGTAMPTPRTELAVALLDGKIYVAGGYGGLRAFERYDPATDTWTSLRDLPMDREHPSLAALRGHLFLTGGRAVETFEYDPVANAWSSRAPLVHDRYAAAAVTLGDAIYVVGGTGANDRALQRYDPDANAWSVLAPLSVTRDHVAAVAFEGKLYALGGRIPGLPSYQMHDSVEVYDPETDTWAAGVSMQVTRSGFGAAVVDGKIYVAGGEVLVQPFSVRDTAEVFDPVSGAWTDAPQLPLPLHGTGATAYGGRVFLFGGVPNPASATPRAGDVHVLIPVGP